MSDDTPVCHHLTHLVLVSTRHDLVYLWLSSCGWVLHQVRARSDSAQAGSPTGTNMRLIQKRCVVVDRNSGSILYRSRRCVAMLGSDSVVINNSGSCRIISIISHFISAPITSLVKACVLAYIQGRMTRGHTTNT